MEVSGGLFERLLQLTKSQLHVLRARVFLFKDVFPAALRMSAQLEEGAFVGKPRIQLILVRIRVDWNGNSCHPGDPRRPFPVRNMSVQRVLYSDYGEFNYNILIQGVYMRNNT